MKVLQDLNGSFNEEIPSRNLREALSKSSRAQENMIMKLLAFAMNTERRIKKKSLKIKKVWKK